MLQIGKCAKDNSKSFATLIQVKILSLRYNKKTSNKKGAEIRLDVPNILLFIKKSTLMC